MDKKYKGSSCELVDAYVILTRQGVVLASDDAKLTPGEDRELREMNLRLIDRSKKTDVDGNFRSWAACAVRNDRNGHSGRLHTGGSIRDAENLPVGRD